MGIIVGTQETKDRVLSTEPGTQCMATQGHQALHAYTPPHPRTGRDMDEAHDLGCGERGEAGEQVPGS